MTNIKFSPVPVTPTLAQELESHTTKTLELSTAHLPENEAQTVQLCCSRRVIDHEFGWMMPVPLNDEAFELEPMLNTVTAEGFPVLSSLLRLAVELRFDWLYFDCDVEPVEALPQFDW